MHTTTHLFYTQIQARPSSLRFLGYKPVAWQMGVVASWVNGEGWESGSGVGESSRCFIFRSHWVHSSILNHRPRYHGCLETSSSTARDTRAWLQGWGMSKGKCWESSSLKQMTCCCIIYYYKNTGNVCSNLQPITADLGQEEEYIGPVIDWSSVRHRIDTHSCGQFWVFHSKHSFDVILAEFRHFPMPLPLVDAWDGIWHHYLAPQMLLV